MMGIMSKAQKVERNADHVEAPIDKPKALDGSPFLVIGYPSSSVAAFLDSPGMFSRIAVIDPPNTVTEWSAIRTGSPTSGLSLKMKANVMAMADIPPKPGSTPTMRPQTVPINTASK